MKITKKQLKRIIQEERKKLLKESPMPMTSLASPAIASAVSGQRVIKEYSEYASHADLSDHVEDMFGMMEEVMIKYVDSGWLSSQDQGSIARNLEKLFDDMNQLNNTFMQLAAKGRIQ